MTFRSIVLGMPSGLVAAGFGELLFVGMLWLFGPAMIVAGFTQMKKKWLVRDTPTQRVESMAMGTVEIKGDAVPAGETFEAPLSTAECVGYRYVIEELQDDPDDEGSEWNTVHTERRMAPFRLDDGTGRVLVDADRAEIKIDRSHEIRSDRVEKGILARLWDRVGRLVGREPEPRYPDVPDETLEDVKDSPTGRPRKHKEYAIRTGESVYVFGEAMHSRDAVWADDGEDRAAENLGLAARLVDAVTPGVSMDEIRQSHHGGGRPVEAEVDGAGRDAGAGGGSDAGGAGDTPTSDGEAPEDASGAWSVFEQIAAMADDARTVDAVLEEEDVIVSKRESTPMFLISDYSEKRLLDKGLAGGLFFILVGVLVVGAAGYASISLLT